jgi:hypothetical protein
MNPVRRLKPAPPRRNALHVEVGQTLPSVNPRISAIFSHLLRLAALLDGRIGDATVRERLCLTP